MTFTSRQKLTAAALNAAFAEKADAAASAFTQAGTGAVVRTPQDKMRETISVKDFGAAGDGTTDDTANIQKALTAGAGGVVYFPPGTYLVSDALVPLSDTVLIGAGHGSMIKAVSAGWLMNTEHRYGIITLYEVSNVTVRDLRLYGTKLQTDTSRCPKLIHLHTAADITVTDNWLENTLYEGIWSAGDPSLNTRVSVCRNRVTDVGISVAWIGLPAIQLNARHCLIDGNILTTVGTGIGASGTEITVSNNRINGITNAGIGVGDGESPLGITITGNTVEWASTNDPTRGILLQAGPGSPRPVLVSGNLIRFSTAQSAAIPGVGIVNDNLYEVDVSSNTIEVTGAGSGIKVFAYPTLTKARIHGNTIRVYNELGISGGNAYICFGVNVVANAGESALIVSSDNYVRGCTRANTGIAYDYNTNGGGTITTRISNDFTDEGYVRVGATSYNSGEWDNVPITLNVARTSASIPTTGTAKVGDIVYNSAPAASGFLGWVCVTAGSPGTWKTFGAISA